MIQFLVKRFIGLIFVVVGVTFITFILGYLSPSDPIRELMGQKFNYDTWVQLRHAYGLDLPWYTQYFNFMNRLIHFDLGTSFRYQNRAVWDMMKDGVPISMELAFWGLLITLLIGIPSGILSAVKANSWMDTANMSFALVLYALPPYIIAVFAQVIIVSLNKQFDGSWPVSDWGNAWQYTIDDLQHKIVPIIVYAGAGYAYFARLGRTTMLEVLRQDYVRTARAKGLKENVVIYRHALRNAMIPLITVIGLFVGLLVAGSFFIEQIFNIHGIARFAIQSINQRDYPVIQATTVLVAIGVVVGNLISDILYTIADPRIKAE